MLSDVAGVVNNWLNRYGDKEEGVNKEGKATRYCHELMIRSMMFEMITIERHEHQQYVRRMSSALGSAGGYGKHSKHPSSVDAWLSSADAAHMREQWFREYLHIDLEPKEVYNSYLCYVCVYIT